MNSDWQDEDIEARLRLLEKFKSEVEGGKKVVAWFFLAIGGLISAAYYSIQIWSGRAH